MAKRITLAQFPVVPMPTTALCARLLRRGGTRPGGELDKKANHAVRPASEAPMLQRERCGSWKLGLTRASHQAARHQTWVCQDGSGLAGFCDAATSRATRWESEHGDSCVFVRKGFGVQVIEDGMADSSSGTELDATRRLVAAVKGP